jgi:hypothetical protein
MITIFVLSSFLLAQAPSASPSAIRNAVKEQVAVEVANIVKTKVKKAFVGTIISKTEAGFVLTNHKKESRNITTTAEATIKNQAKDVTLKDLKIGDFVIAMGDADASNNLLAKRILVVTKPGEDKRKTMIFTITKASSSNLIVENLKKETWTVKTASDTSYTSKTKISDLEMGDKIAVIGSLASTASTFNALRIHKLTK